MAGLNVPCRGGSLSRALAASLLAFLTGCATLPEPPPPQPAPLSTLTPSQEIAAKPVAKVELPSRLTALARRLLGKFSKSQAPAPVAEPEPQPAPDAVVDEKYRLTGDAALELERGHASWYGGRFQGQRTANGERYNKYALTAAHKTLPFGTIVRVRSLTLGREVDVRINDRGPFAPGRVIDVSQAAAEVLGLKGSGVAEVSLNLADSSLEQEAGARQSRSKAHSSKDKSRSKSKSHSSKDKSRGKDKHSSRDKSHSAKAKPRTKHR